MSNPPKRLVYIENPGDIYVKVIETSINFRESYIALSYCWGKGVCLKTTKTNLLDMMRGIERTNLPSVVSDAISITGVLGFKYIWIDSLCIIQDDVRDWEEESARMCTIYEGAYLTIAASSAESADVPLAERYRCHEPTIFQCRQNANSNGGKLDTIFQLAAREECEYGFHNEDAVRRPDREPLHDRGWTLQEAILSKRVVFYTPTELQWQCQAVQTCQCQIPPPIKPGVITTRAHIRGDPGRPRQLHEIFAAWDRIVEAYTERLLTNPDDKMPALSGLAQLVRRNIIALRIREGNSTDKPSPFRQSRYVAGLWAGDLIRGMLWGPLHMTVNLPYSPAQTTSTTIILGAHVREDISPDIDKASYYRAPSFSWASVDGPVTYRTRNRKLPQDDPSYAETAQVIDVWSCPMSGDRFGRLTTVDNPQRQHRSRTGVVIRAPFIENLALVRNLSRSIHNSAWTLREIETLWDNLWLDTGSVEPFPVVDELASGNCKDERDCEASDDKEELKGPKPKWSVKRTHGPGIKSTEEKGKGTVMGGVSLLMMAQSSQVQYFLLLGISPSDAGAYERLGTVSTSRVSGGGDLVQLSQDIEGAKLKDIIDMEWRGKGGVISRMRTVTIV